VLFRESTIERDVAARDERNLHRVFQPPQKRKCICLMNLWHG
jgi:hypothetical protein